MQFRQEINVVGNFSFTRRSANKKTGPMPVSTSPISTCPQSCPFREKGGCYASAGGPLRLHWDKISHCQRGISYNELLDCVSALPKGMYWRHNQAGDLYGDNLCIDGDAAERLVRANSHVRGFTYTHKPLSYSENRDIILMMNSSGFTVNISCNSLHEVGKISQQFPGFPLTVVLPYDINTSVHSFSLSSGQRIVLCPAVYTTITCQQCKLCAVPTRKSIVGFPAHGTQKRAASHIAAVHIHEYL